MKIILLSILFISPVFSQSNEQLLQEIKQLKQRMEKMEGGKKKGLKTTDYGNETTSAPSNRVNQQSGQGSNAQQPTPEQMKQIMDSLKKGDSYMKERDKFLKDMDDEGL